MYLLIIFSFSDYTRNIYFYRWNFVFKINLVSFFVNDFCVLYNIAKVTLEIAIFCFRWSQWQLLTKPRQRSWSF